MGAGQKDMRYILTLFFGILTTCATFAQHHLQPQIKAELDYYLQRHNVMDEGFSTVSRYAAEGDSTLDVYMPVGKVSPFGLFQRWKNHLREGKCIVTDSQQRIIIGTFHADTLVSGIRIDSLGIYAGQFNRHWQASGHGSYQHADGSYYEGHWEYDMRHGFGFCVSTDNLRAGVWRNDRFRGERMNYHSDRIYGIDISRYQHERGRRKYTVDWNRMRIVSFGNRISQERVTGTVDYPVSFVFVKASEGISIVNRYFTADYENCRRRNIPVGAYHFFSTKQTPREQASHFLKTARFQRGDLPPMLDIEPSDAQINQMGGAEVMFRNIRIWLDIVERRVGVRPLLYVNQRFVNTWIDPYAPDLKRDYLFWIARYGDYKPDIHLAFWQMTDNGRVNGITPTVDIDAFNGYEGHWQEFLRENCIK